MHQWAWLSIGTDQKRTLLIPLSLFFFPFSFFLYHINLLLLSRFTLFSHPLIFKCRNIYSTTHMHKTGQAWRPCGPEKKATRQRGSEGGGGGSSSRLTRADLIKLPVTLTNLLVLSHCVESSPPLLPDAPRAQHPLSFFPTSSPLYPH